jgi:hypothetical protein
MVSAPKPENPMEEKQWSFDDELFESRAWAPRRSNLRHDWKSVTSEKWLEIQELVRSESEK